MEPTAESNACRLELAPMEEKCTPEMPRNVQRDLRMVLRAASRGGREDTWLSGLHAPFLALRVYVLF